MNRSLSARLAIAYVVLSDDATSKYIESARDALARGGMDVVDLQTPDDIHDAARSLLEYADACACIALADHSSFGPLSLGGESCELWK